MTDAEPGRWADPDEDDRADKQQGDPHALDRVGDPRGGVQSPEYRHADPREIVEEGADRHERTGWGAAGGRDARRAARARPLLEPPAAASASGRGCDAVGVDGLTTGEDGVTRCWWAGADPLMRAYHDDEWGRPERRDERLYELLTLESFQSGLSWQTILNKREGFRRAFAGFDAVQVAAFCDADIERLLGDASIVRHRGKIEAAVANARAIAALDGPLAELLWSFAPPARPRPRTGGDVPAQMPEAAALAGELKTRGFRFLGPTTVYAFMQAAGLVDDHVEGCAVPGAAGI